MSRTISERPLSCFECLSRPGEPVAALQARGKARERLLEWEAAFGYVLYENIVFAFRILAQIGMCVI